VNEDSRRFYVYLWLRHKNSKHGPKLSPYYVGKGSGNRAFNPRGRRVKPPKDWSYIVFAQEGLTEQEAFDLERYCIALYGRKDLGTGILCNFTDGGEGVSGLRHSQEARAKLSLANMGNQHFLGKTHTQESRNKIAEARLKYLYELTNSNGDIYVTDNLTHFTRQHDLSQGNLVNVIHGKRKSHKGWTGRIIEQLR
jgi:hypothetical protein